MPAFLWRFKCGRRRLNSNNESHWLQVSAYKLLEYYSSNMDMQSFQQHINILLYSVVFIKVFRKKGVLKNFAIFTRKHLCWSPFGVFGVNFVKERLQHIYFPVNITKFLRVPILKNIWERCILNSYSKEHLSSCFCISFFIKLR